ncbi:MAG: YihY family inner membrane protein [Pseudomonadota bacterium]|nr:YihY family inner membrane protein [Pseudomonadota bacterium]
MALEIASYAGYATRRFADQNGLQAAAALTFTTLLAVVPLLAITLGVFSAFPAFAALRGYFEEALFANLVPQVGEQARLYLASFARNTTKLTAVGMVALAVSAVMLLMTIQSTLNRIFAVRHQRTLILRVLVFWSLLTLGPVLLALALSLTSDLAQVARATVSDAGFATGGFETRAGWPRHVLAIALEILAFTGLYVIVPNRPVPWRDGLIGGLLAELLLEVLKRVFALYFMVFPAYQTIYGALATIPIFLIWLYACWTVILIGAVFAASFSDWWAQRRVDRDDQGDDSLAATLRPALLILACLRAQSQIGGGSPSDGLAGRVGFSDFSDIIAQLIAAGYVEMSEDQSLVLARDPTSASLYDLYRDLGLATATETTDESGDPAAERAGAPAALAALRRRLNDAERTALDQPLADILAELPAKPAG